MCMAAGIEPPAEIFVHGYLLMGGQKLGKTMIASGVAGTRRRRQPLNITDVSPLALADDFGVDPLRYHLLREVRARRATATSPTRASWRATTRTWPTIWATWSRGSPPWCTRSAAGSARPRNPTSALADVAAPVSRRGHGGLGPLGARTRRWRRRGASSARPTPSSSRPSPGRWTPGPPSTPSSATRSRSSGSWPSWSPRPCLRRRPRCGAASAWTATRVRPCSRRRPTGAATPAGVAVVKGEPLFPRRKA